MDDDADGLLSYVSRPNEEWKRRPPHCFRPCSQRPCSCITMPAESVLDDLPDILQNGPDAKSPRSDPSDSEQQQSRTLCKKQSFSERFNKRQNRQVRSFNSVPNGRSCLRYLGYKFIPRSQSLAAIASRTSPAPKTGDSSSCECPPSPAKDRVHSLSFIITPDKPLSNCGAKPYHQKAECQRLFNRDGTPVVRRRPRSVTGPPLVRYNHQQQTQWKRQRKGRPHSSYEPERQHLEETSTSETLDVICSYLTQMKLDTGKSLQPSKPSPEAMKYTREKLKARTCEDLSTLLEDFYRQIQMVSEELVELLQRRHELREQVDMRRIATEQLLRLHKDDQETLKLPDGSSAIQMGVLLPEKHDDASNQR